jgi:hypothetical protein
MSRSLTSGSLAAALSKRVAPIILAQITFKDGVQYAWTGIGNLVWSGNTYTGIGTLGKIGPITEDTQVQAQGLQLELTGVPQSELNEALGQCQQGNTVNVYFGFLDSSGAIIADPYLAFSGRMDVPTIDEGAETATITLTAENRLVDLQRPRQRNFTHQDQITEFPSDTGFTFVPLLQQLNLVWGKGNNIPVTSSGGVFNNGSSADNFRWGRGFGG